MVQAALGAVANGQQDKGQDFAVPRIKVMTYNIKFASPSYEPSWTTRRDWQVDMIKDYAPDIIGTQEGLKGTDRFSDGRVERLCRRWGGSQRRRCGRAHGYLF